MLPGDASAVAALVRAAFANQPVSLDPPPSALRLSSDDVVANLRDGGGAVAEIAGRITGSIMWVPREDAFYIARLAVDPEQRRLGIAGALLVRAEEAARAAPVRHLILETRLALVGNRRLFAAHGYREVSRSAHPGYTEPTSVLMEKRLAD